MHTRTTLGLAVAAAATLLTPAAAQATTAAPTPVCGSAALHASYRASDAGAGHVYGWIVLRNTSGHSCRTGGFSGISYVGGGNGTQIGAPATWTASPRKSFTLKPGQRVREQLDEVHAENYPKGTCKPRKVDGLRIYVPGATKSQYVPHATVGCADRSVHLMSTKALVRP